MAKMIKYTLKKVILFIAVLYVAACSCNNHKPIPADSVLINCRIYTVNPEEPWVQAIAVSEGKIVALGSDESIAVYQGAFNKGYRCERKYGASRVRRIPCAYNGRSRYA